MRRHRVHESELPAVKLGLHWYLSENCDYQQDDENNIIHAFRLYYRIINYRVGQPEGQPNYPFILDEQGRIDYGTIISHLEAAEEIDPTLLRMVPFMRESIIPLEDIDQMPVLPRTGFHIHLSSGQTSEVKT